MPSVDSSIIAESSGKVQKDEDIFTLNAIDESETKAAKTDMTFNGINMLQQQDYLDCKLKTGTNGQSVSVKIPLLDYEIMCKQAGDFCNCETGNIEVTDSAALENVLNEVYITRTITKEVYADDDGLDLDKESNQIAFIAGIVVSLLIVGTFAFVIIMCMRKRMNVVQKIVLTDAQGRPIENAEELGGS